MRTHKGEMRVSGACWVDKKQHMTYESKKVKIEKGREREEAGRWEGEDECVCFCKCVCGCVGVSLRECVCV